MGLGRGLLAEFTALKRSGALEKPARVIEIGAQQLSDDFLQSNDLLDEIYALFGRARSDLGTLVGQENYAEQAPSSRGFWTSLGLDYAAIDYDGHRNSVALDLNRDQVPATLKGKFDLVVNAGTTEHVANQENAFRIIHDLTAHRGVMLHDVPAGGMIDHGFFNYNPRFFQRVAAFNLYEVLLLQFSSGSASPIPQSARDDNVRFGGGEDRIREQSVMDFAIRAAFRRQTRKEFETPLDVPPQTLRLKNRQPWLGLRHALARRLNG